MAVGLSWREASDIPVAWLEAVATQGTERTYPVPTEDGANIDKGNQVIVVRHEDRLYAFALACPHENTALSWRARAQRFQCRLHDSRYEADGTFIDGRATRNMDRYAVRLLEGELVVDLAKTYHSDEQPDEWKTAVIVL